VAGEVAAGDLRNAVQQLSSEDGAVQVQENRKTGSDEIGTLSTAFCGMVASLHSLIGHVRNSGIQVVSSATEISASARELEASAAQQAASVTQVSVTSRQISSGSRELVQTMGGVVAVASETAALAREGQTGLQGMEATMVRLMEATGSIASKLETISEKTNNIGSVVTTINRVADRTNLLSLNAAIEAEKAGEYGLGFAVVAREIRRLADQSAVATLDIEQMVKEMQSAVSSGVMEVDKFVQQVRQGGDVIANIGGQLASIIDQVQALIPRFDEVNRAMETQSTSAEEISGAMLQLSEGAEQTRQVVSEFNRVVEQLTGAVHVLQNEVSKFRLEADSRSES
jgi:methyl-accepting chemotaxis protein WspA